MLIQETKAKLKTQEARNLVQMPKPEDATPEPTIAELAMVSKNASANEWTVTARTEVGAVFGPFESGGTRYEVTRVTEDHGSYKRVLVTEVDDLGEGFH